MARLERDDPALLRRDPLAASVVHYVTRTAESVVVDDAPSHPSVEARGPLSEAGRRRTCR